eukprot:GILK01000955.1.p1 GENE.GILK01000955.1~~GILK01000955.1.p1  ORF type:complete len:829 (+),score=153.94 GILK01000955.1:41-2488(+)
MQSPSLFVLVALLSVVHAGRGPTHPEATALTDAERDARDVLRGQFVLNRMSPVGGSHVFSLEDGGKCPRLSALEQIVSDYYGGREQSEDSQTRGFLSSRRKRVVVIGAGPAGLYAAIKLAKDHEVVVYDKYVTPSRARFLGLFSQERDLLNELGLDVEKITYFPEGKPSKRGILAADLDASLGLVAERLGVKVCRGYRVKKLKKMSCANVEDDNFECAEGSRFVWGVKLTAMIKEEWKQDKHCRRSRRFHTLIYAGGSRSRQLSNTDKKFDDLPTKYLGSPVLPMETLALRGLLFAATLVKPENSLINRYAPSDSMDDSGILGTPIADPHALAAFGRSLSELEDSELAAILEAAFRHSVEPWLSDDKKLSASREIFGGAFEDVEGFSALFDPELRDPFLQRFRNVLTRQEVLEHYCYVSNVAPAFLHGFGVTATQRQEVADALNHYVPDFLFLNLGVKDDAHHMTVKRLHWEGPLPGGLYKAAIQKLKALTKSHDEYKNMDLLLTYAVINRLAARVAADLGLTASAHAEEFVSLAEFTKENWAAIFNSERSASIFRAEFSASSRVHGRIPADEDFEPQDFFIVGDAAQDAWYRFGLGVHDAFNSVTHAVNCITAPSTDECNGHMKRYRNYQSLRALQIQHAVFAGEYAYQTKFKEFAESWMNQAKSDAELAMQKPSKDTQTEPLAEPIAEPIGESSTESDQGTFSDPTPALDLFTSESSDLPATTPPGDEDASVRGTEAEMAAGSGSGSHTEGAEGAEGAEDAEGSPVDTLQASSQEPPSRFDPLFEKHVELSAHQKDLRGAPHALSHLLLDVRG